MPEQRPVRNPPRRWRLSTFATALVGVLVIGMLLLAIYVWLQQKP